MYYLAFRMLPAMFALWLIGCGLGLLLRIRHARLLTMLAVTRALPLAVRQYPHYLQLAAPFGVMLGGAVVSKLIEKCRGRRWALPAGFASLVLAMLLVVPSIKQARRVVRYLRLERPMAAQQAIVTQIWQALPPRSEALFVNGPQYAFAADLRVPSDTGASFMFGPADYVDLSGVCNVLVFLHETDYEAVVGWLHDAGITKCEPVVPGEVLLYTRPAPESYQLR
jgi:hypothetical protein